MKYHKISQDLLPHTRVFPKTAAKGPYRAARARAEPFMEAQGDQSQGVPFNVGRLDLRGNESSFAALEMQNPPVLIKNSFLEVGHPAESIFSNMVS